MDARKRERKERRSRSRAKCLRLVTGGRRREVEDGGLVNVEEEGGETPRVMSQVEDFQCCQRSVAAYSGWTA
jgi:hypothetical protein